MKEKQELNLIINQTEEAKKITIKDYAADFASAFSVLSVPIMSLSVPINFLISVFIFGHSETVVSSRLFCYEFWNPCSEWNWLIHHYVFDNTV